MTPQHISDVLNMYSARLRAEGVPKRRMDTARTFASLNRAEILAHAHYLTDGALGYAAAPDSQGKANRHLTAVQMCLGFAGWYTLDDLRSHNV